jgi:hypothetical protein
VFCSDGPACCQLIQKAVQDRRKDGGQDQSQDPDGFGLYLWRAGNDHEAGKSDNSRHGTHGDSNKHADDNLLHVIPLHLATFQKGPNGFPDFASHQSRLFYKLRLIYQLIYSSI